MASSTSYEVYAFKAGNWNIDSVYDDKEMALYEARVLLDSRHLSAVQVIEEKFDADTGETLSKIIYRARKGDDRKPKAKTPAASSDEKIKAPMPPKKAVDEQAGFIKYVVIMVLSDGAFARGSGLYDMSIFLNSPHPFAGPAPAAQPAPAQPTTESYDEGDDALIDDLGPEAPAEDTDWLEPVNRTFFAAIDIIYAVFLEPIAKLYQVVVPEFARTGVSNAIQNLNTPVILANDLMQGEFGRAWETTERFAVNTTVGLGGTIDVAEKWLGIPPHKEDFSQTMAVWGVPEGGYLVIPLLGPSSPRAAFGRFGVDSFLDPLNLWLANTDRDKYVYLRTGVTALAEYESVMDELGELREMSVDYYATVRSLYRQRRAADIANGKAAVPDI